MPAENLQTVIVSKDVAKTRKKAEKLARLHANRIYTSRETSTSWRFRQRPPSDFKKDSFRTKRAGSGISLVYGALKAAKKKAKKRVKKPPSKTRGKILWEQDGTDFVSQEFSLGGKFAFSLIVSMVSKGKYILYGGIREGRSFWDPDYAYHNANGYSLAKVKSDAQKMLKAGLYTRIRLKRGEAGLYSPFTLPPEDFFNEKDRFVHPGPVAKVIAKIESGNRERNPFPKFWRRKPGAESVPPGRQKLHGGSARTRVPGIARKPPVDPGRGSGALALPPASSASSASPPSARSKPAKKKRGKGPRMRPSMPPTSLRVPGWSAYQSHIEEEERQLEARRKGIVLPKKKAPKKKAPKKKAPKKKAPKKKAPKKKAPKTTPTPDWLKVYDRLYDDYIELKDRLGDISKRGSRERFIRELRKHEQSIMSSAPHDTKGVSFRVEPAMDPSKFPPGPGAGRVKIKARLIRGRPGDQGRWWDKLVARESRAGNPNGQKHFQWEGAGQARDGARDWDFWISIEPKIKRSKTEAGLARLAKQTLARDIQSITIRAMIFAEIADRARELKIYRNTRSHRGDERYVHRIAATKNPARKKTPKRKSKKTTKKKAKKKTSKSRVSKKSPRAQKLKSPTEMPDPGPCGWLGSTLELAFDSNGSRPRWAKTDGNGRTMWECGRGEWMCLWSPKYKAVVAIRRPRGIKGGPGSGPQSGKVVRRGGGAKSWERFAARAAEQTQEIEIPAVPLKKLGEGVHIVYRSDKWSKSRDTTDYIHDFKRGVEIYCGPSIEKPEVFICFGGKLTLTERGLVF